MMRRCDFAGSLLGLAVLMSWGGGASLHAEVVDYCFEPEILDNSLAVDGMIGWPKISALPDGTLALALFNQPNHQVTAGDIELWVSEDEGDSWRYRSTPAPREPGTTRVNHAIGLAGNGDLLVIAGGKAYDEPDRPLIRPWVCRSSDGGNTWDIQKEVFPNSLDDRALVPFGNVVSGPDGSLRVPAYIPYYGPTISYIVRSDDDGANWYVDSTLPTEDPVGETSILHLGEGEWLAASRINLGSHYLELFRSVDDMRTWEDLGKKTASGEMPGHLLELDDGAILMTYGNRVAGAYGADAKVSFDRGQTWSESFKLGSASASDCGYPGSVQLPDGDILTVYYAAATVDHPEYHVRSVRWQLNKQAVAFQVTSEPDDVVIFTDTGQLGTESKTHLAVGSIRYEGDPGRELAGVLVFQLPDLGGRSVTAADFQFGLWEDSPTTGVPDFDVDLYGIGWRAAAEVVAGDHVGGTILQRRVLSSLEDSFSAGTTMTTNKVGDANLAGFLNLAYQQGAQPGDYVFLRMDPKFDGVPDADLRYNVMSGNAVDHPLIPTLLVRTGEIPVEGVPQATAYETGRPIYLDNGDLGLVGPVTHVTGSLDGRRLGAVLVFELPELQPGHELDSANLDVAFANTEGTPDFNLDLYALGWRSSPDVISDDAFGGNLIQDDLLFQPLPETTGEVYSADEAGQANLLAWIENAYAEGAEAGDFLFFRLEPDADWVAPEERTYIRIYSGLADSALRPCLTLDTSGPLEAVPGDLDGDGFVGGDDLDLVRAFWGQEVIPGFLSQGDASGDGFVGGDDLDILRAHWGQSVSAPPILAVPEPSTTLLLFGGGLFLFLGGMRREARFFAIIRTWRKNA